MTAVENITENFVIDVDSCFVLVSGKLVRVYSGNKIKRTDKNSPIRFNLICGKALQDVRERVVPFRNVVRFRTVNSTQISAASAIHRLDYANLDTGFHKRNAL